MPNEAEKVIKNGQEVATKQVGPLPVWGWIVGGIVVGGVVYFVFLRSGSGGAGGGGPLSNGMQILGGGGGGGGGGSAPSPENPVAALTNAQWLEKAVAAVNSAIPGLSPGLARLYLNDYLAGTSPQGQNASSTFDRVIAAAKQAIGEAPQLPTFQNNVNPYANNITWLSQALGFSQNLGLSQSVRNELTNLAYGTTSSISQEAATALSALRDLVGNEPMPLAFTVNAPPVTPSTPGAPSWDQVFSLQKVQSLIDTGLSFGRANPHYYENVDLVAGIYRDVFGITDAQARQAAFAVKSQGGNWTDPNAVRSTLLSSFQPNTRTAQ